jgi:hypothetical protein
MRRRRSSPLAAHNLQRPRQCSGVHGEYFPQLALGQFPGARDHLQYGELARAKA